MTQTTPGAFELIENMASSSLNKNKEHDRSKSVNSIDDLAAKVDQLLKGNQSQVFIMEEAAPEKSAGDLAFDAEISGDDHQEVSYVNGQGWQLKNNHPNPNVRNNPQLFWPKQDKPADPTQSNQGQYTGYQKNYQPQTYVLSHPQNNPLQVQKHQNTQPATSAPVTVPQDETKSMLQQLLQGQQLQGKALNQSVKRQRGTLLGKTDKNPKECNAVELRSGKQLSEPVKKRFSAAEKGKLKVSEQPPTDTPAAEKEREPTVGTNSPGPEQPAEAVRPIPEPIPAREYNPKVTYPVPAKATRKDREEMKCRKMLEDLTILLYEKPLRKKRESSDKSSKRIVTQRPNTCSARSLRSNQVRAKAQSLHNSQTPIPLGRYVATKRLPGHYIATELEPKFSRYAATELFRNVDTTSVHAFLSTLRCYLPNTLANPSHVPRHF
ncbi:hypothetical protein DY000_02046660 [Brassica cretica]|uniref:Uncharacterized protein n=1 Tax=Brassica cretica TaxID=69181 RepID=A0ABQ7F5P0_BRACR|nr:hypothetical protein DY000_02046660 [Brassica cretica]